MAPARWLRVAVVLALASWSVPAVWGEDSKPPEGAKPAPGVVDVRFADGTSQKVTLLDQKIEFTTRYGKITVPSADVLGLDLATRIPEEVAKEIEKAVADLGSPEFKAREAASATLQQLGPRAYPAVLEASKSNDAEVKRRAEAILAQLRKAMPADMLKVRKQDVLIAGDCTFTGRIEVVTLRVKTAEGKEREVKLADVRGLRSPALKAQLSPAMNVRPDPGTTQTLGGNVGTVFFFRVTGATGGPLWGSDVYTNDSMIAKAAVHAGVLKEGETGVVKVTIVAPLATYQGTTRNGVTSAPYGPWPGAYTVEKAESDD
jgi:hypothetical protein